MAGNYSLQVTDLCKKDSSLGPSLFQLLLDIILSQKLMLLVMQMKEIKVTHLCGNISQDIEILMIIVYRIFHLLDGDQRM
jgi:hypothetical protein